MNQTQIQLDTAPIETWRQFTAQVRMKGYKLLKTLDEYQDAVLVTGCQRSGTTMLARILTQSDGMVNYWVGPDDELDAALILSGYTPRPSPGRYCFQTTYVDEFFHEYFEHNGNFKIIWLLRNPFSVVCSLLYNWKAYALNETFKDCAATGLNGRYAILYKLFGIKSISKTHRACEVYKAKTRQLFELFDTLGPKRMLILDYDELVLQKETTLPKLYQYINLEFNPQYLDKIHRKSINKKSRLTKSETRLIQKLAQPIYEKALMLKNKTDYHL